MVAETTQRSRIEVLEFSGVIKSFAAADANVRLRLHYLGSSTEAFRMAVIAEAGDNVAVIM